MDSGCEPCLIYQGILIIACIQYMQEAVVHELKRMNDDVLENQDGDCPLKDSEPFKKQYAAVLIQLNEVNEQV